MNRWKGVDMNGRRLFLLLILIMVLTGSGCSLVNDDLQQLKDGDQLIGLFIVYEGELKDYEMQDGDTLYYQEKKMVRADGSVEQLTDEQIRTFNGDWTLEGKKQADGTYTFGQLKGYYMGYAVTKELIDGEPSAFVDTRASAGIYDTHMSVTANGPEGGQGGGEDIYSLEGTLGVSTKGPDRLRAYIIHQRTDGSVYVTSSNASTIIWMDTFSQGGKQSYSMSESYETTLTGTGIHAQQTKQTRSLTLNVEAINQLQKADILQMDGQHQVVGRTQLNFSEGADGLIQEDQKLILDEKTEYAIIEEYFIDKEGKEEIKRTAYDWFGAQASSSDEEESLWSHSFFATDEKGYIRLIMLNVER